MNFTKFVSIFSQYLSISPVRATSHLSVGLTAMCATVDENSSHLCQILPPSIVKHICRQEKHNCIARRPVIT